MSDDNYQKARTHRGDDLVTGSTKKSADNSPALMGRTFSVKTCTMHTRIKESLSAYSFSISSELQQSLLT